MVCVCECMCHDRLFIAICVSKSCSHSESRFLSRTMRDLLDPLTLKDGLHRISGREQLLARDLDAALTPLRTIWEGAAVTACVKHLAYWMQGPGPERQAAFKDSTLSCSLSQQGTLAEQIRHALQSARDILVSPHISKLTEELSK